MNKNVIEPVAAEGTGTVKQEGDITIEKPVYTFRKLKSEDMFPMFSIIGKIGINKFAQSFGTDNVKEMIATLVGGKNDGESRTVVGISVMLEMVNIILGNLPKCKDDIYQLLSNVSNLTVDEIKELDFATFTEMVVEFVKKKEFKDFMKVVSKSFK